MTALQKYERLEATGLWRETPDGQRREVVVSIGDATLVISDLNDTALTHWSLAAVERGPDNQKQSRVSWPLGRQQSLVLTLFGQRFRTARAHSRFLTSLAAVPSMIPMSSYFPENLRIR